MNTKRLIATSVILFSILFLPYWVYLPLLVLAIVIFPFYWEAILFALFIDAVFGEGTAFNSSFIFSTTSLALILVIASIPMRERLRLNI